MTFKVINSESVDQEFLIQHFYIQYQQFLNLAKTFPTVTKVAEEPPETEVRETLRKRLTGRVYTYQYLQRVLKRPV